MSEPTVQFGSSDSADFEKSTWTFEMPGGFRVGAGPYAILRREEYEALRQQLEEAQRKYEYRDSILAEILAAVLGPHFVPESGFDAAVERIDDRLTELLAAERRLASAEAQEAVAWGIPNSRPTERNPLMQVLLDKTSCQYPELLIPLYLHPAPPATDERVKELTTRTNKERPKKGVHVLAAIQHWYTKNVRYAVLESVHEDDCDWRTDGCELSHDWNVIAWDLLPDAALAASKGEEA